MWRKAKKALSVNLCAYVPRSEMEWPPPGKPEENVSGVSSVSSVSGVSVNSEKNDSSKNFCAICRNSIKTGQAIFTAECSHTFHFKCITLNVKHGNHVCPICRAKWKEVPFHGSQNSDHLHGRARVRPVKTNLAPFYQSSEPSSFDDDEPLNVQSNTIEEIRHGCVNKVEMKTYLEYSAIPKSAIEQNFAILIHLKAPCGKGDIHKTSSQTTRAPVDLVTVLDISGSMAGTKLALLKRAMGFLIQSLGPSDRLSVIAFSSTSRRLFNLRHMSESGRQLALQAVNSLVACGGTNIADGLKKGAKVIEERKEKNPVCSIILLSDGQDIYNISPSAGGGPRQTDYRSLLPSSSWNTTSHQIPVHAFGFGSDHDAAALHFITETTGGTFSFVEAEAVIQDAFAQCIGGLLSVVVQKLNVVVECVHHGVQISDIKCGSYSSQMASDKRKGSINVGDLYADEKRDFLVYLNVPQAHQEDTTMLLRVWCFYQDVVSKESVQLKTEEVMLQRPETVEEQKVSLNVDRQRNRIFAAEAMAAARAAAERNALSEAVSILENHRNTLSNSVAAKSGDRMCVALDAEMREMQERMANRHRYESSGRAFVLSGLSSHSWQRATARGDSTQSSTSVHAYQTPSMVEMLGRSQILQAQKPHRR